MRPVPASGWAVSGERPFATLARNASARYVALITDIGIGLLTLPLNLAYLGTAEYGLWVLLGSLTVHLSLFDLGFSGALVKFVAQYRARRDSRALNEIASTMCAVFGAIGFVGYLLLAGVAFNLEHLFRLSAAQAQLGQWVLLIIGVQVALNFPFSVFGGITGGFQRYDINSAAAVATSIGVAIVNVALVLSGYGLIALVAGTTSVRLVAFLVYRANAYRVYPELRIRPSLVRKSRLKEVTGFSIYASIIDWANKLNYQLDTLVIGAFLGSAAVAVWAPAERIISGVQRLTNQVNGVMFPLIVDSDQRQQEQRLRQILLQGTRLSLAMTMPICAALLLLADPLLRAWLGARASAVAGAVPVIQILAIAVAIRVGDATATTLLKGAGQHKMLAFTNLGTGVVNVTLSALLIGPFGLIGVAYGTLLPIAFAASFLLFPAACRRVGVSVPQAIVQAVLPALWPAGAAAALLWVLRPYTPDNLAGVLLASAITGVIYLALFLGLAIGRRDRAFYLAKAREVFARTPRAQGGAESPVTVLGGQ